MSKPYVVTVLDFGNTVETLDFDTFAEALTAYREAKLNYATKFHAVGMHNDNRYDVDHDGGWIVDDGLTADERDALDAVA